MLQRTKLYLIIGFMVITITSGAQEKAKSKLHLEGKDLKGVLQELNSLPSEMLESLGINPMDIKSARVFEKHNVVYDNTDEPDNTLLESIYFLKDTNENVVSIGYPLNTPNVSVDKINSIRAAKSILIFDEASNECSLNYYISSGRNSSFDGDLRVFYERAGGPGFYTEFDMLVTRDGTFIKKGNTLTDIRLVSVKNWNALKPEITEGVKSQKELIFEFNNTNGLQVKSIQDNIRLKVPMQEFKKFPVIRN